MYVVAVDCKVLMLFPYVETATSPCWLSQNGLRHLQPSQFLELCSLECPIEQLFAS